MKHISESILSKKTGQYIRFPSEPDLDGLKKFFDSEHFLDYGKPATEEDLIKFSKEFDCPAYSIGSCKKDDLTSFWIKWTKPEKSNVAYMVRTLDEKDADRLTRTGYSLYYIIITKPKYDLEEFNNFDAFRKSLETSGGI